MIRFAFLKGHSGYSEEGELKIGLRLKAGLSIRRAIQVNDDSESGFGYWE